MRQTSTPGTTPRRFFAARRSAILAGVAAAVLATLLPTVEAMAQTFDNRPPVFRPRPGMRGGGGGGVGAAIGIGLGLGLLGAAAARAAAEEDARPPGRGRPSRPVRVIEDDADEVRPPRRGGETPPPRRRPPQQAERTPGPAIRVPAASETRFVAGEVLVEMANDRAIGALAERLRLRVVASEPVRLTGSTLHRLRADDGRTTQQILTRLQRERTVAFAQPNWVYTLQQAGVAAPAGELPPAAAAADAVPPAGETVAAASATTGAGTAAAPTGVGPGGGSAVQPLPGQYAADKLRLPGAHGRARGTGVLVAVIDTGADESHPELAGAVAASYDALDGVAAAPGVHGTAMAGAIAARVRLAGSAPAARLLVARAFGPPAADGVAQGSTFHVVKCLDWSVTSGARIVSMSFAGPSNDLLARALGAARAKGVIAVAAAGNAGPQSPPLFPAADPGVIAVTASDPDDRILPVANRGGHVLVTAPGVDIVVAAPKGGYDLTSGTSVAAAEVSGVVALLVEKRGDLTPDEARRILAATAIDLGPKGRDPIFGAGLVDAEAAVGAVAGRAR